jgi:hypothetical protein
MKPWHWIILVLLVAASLALEFTDQGEHGHHSWSGIPAFYLLFGFLGSCLLILFSKLVLGPVLQRDEHYYER